MWSLAVLILCLTTAATAQSAGCVVNVQDGFGKPQSLILNANSTAFAVPFDEEDLHFARGEEVVFACPGGTVKLGKQNTKKEQITAKCSSATSFQLDNGKYYFNQITCTKLPFHTARFTGKTCLDNKKEIEIGFNLKQTSNFIRLVTICFDDEEKSALYSQFTMSHRLDAYQSKFPRPNFVQGNFYDFSVNNLYKRNNQRANINRQLGLSASSTKYIKNSNDYFLSRGHLAAKADFIYGALQRATFHYVNVAPQWQIFNGKNWNDLEMDIRNYVSRQENDLTLYSGTHGVTTLPHEDTGEDVPLYLSVSGQKKAIPIPQLFWRVLYDPVEQKGVAFVGINNPYHEDVDKEIVCTDICDKLKWLNWDAHNAKLGYSYCCSVDEVRSVISNIPEFTVNDLLT